MYGIFLNNEHIYQFFRHKQGLEVIATQLW